MQWIKRRSQMSSHVDMSRHDNIIISALSTLVRSLVAG